MARKFLITGGSGLVGRRLTQQLLTRGYEVSHLTRKKKSIPKVREYVWDFEKEIIDESAFLGADTLIHLAGEGIADKPWTQARKKAIIESREKSIEFIYKVLKNNVFDITTCVSSGAIGYYGDRGDEWLTERSAPGTDYLSETCQRWEHAVSLGENLGLRVAQLRMGVVLSPDGGALPAFEKPAKFGVGSALGRGNQWVSWIHLDDLCRIFVKAAESAKYNGIFNAVADGPVTNKDFIKILSGVLKKPFFVPPVPAPVLRLLLGERAEIILNSQRVSNQKLVAHDFEFQFKQLAGALSALYQKN